MKAFTEAQQEFIAALNATQMTTTARQRLYELAATWAMAAATEMGLQAIEIASTEPTYTPVMTDTHEAGVTIVEPVTDGC